MDSVISSANEDEIFWVEHPKCREPRKLTGIMPIIQCLRKKKIEVHYLGY